MAPDPKTTEPANEQWLQLRGKHDADLQEFQLRVQEANARFLQNVERERKEILDGHAEEKKAFWSKPNNVKKPTAKKTSAKSQGNSTVAASTAKIGRRANQTPGSNPRITQNPKNAASTPKSSRTTSQLSPGTTTATASSSHPASKKAAVAYIDLCSDDDEPVVLQKTIQSPAADSYQEKPRSIPTATLKLFGKNVKPSTVTPESEQFKREPSVFIQPPSVPATSPTTQRRHEDATSSPQFPSSNIAEPAPNAASQIQRSNFSDSNGFDIWATSNLSNLPPIRDRSGATISTGNWSLVQTDNVSGASPSQHLHQPGSGETNSSRQPLSYSPWATPTVSAFKGLNSYKPESDGRPSPAGLTKPEPSPSLSAFTSLNASPRVERPHHQPRHTLVEQDIKQSAYDSLSPHHKADQGEPALVPPSRKDIEMIDGYSPMRHGPHTPHASSNPTPPSTPRPQQHVPNMIPPSSGVTGSPRTPTRQTTFSRLSSPQSPATLIPGSSARINPSGSAFRIPSFPASASRDAVPVARNIRAGSQTSKSSLQTSATRKNDHDTSVTSQTAISSSRSTVIRGRKRPIIDLSSDEEARDYSPPSDNDEIDSPEGDGKPSKGRKQAPGSATKKAKIFPSGVSSTLAPFFLVSRKQKTKTDSQAPSSSPCTPPRKPGGRPSLTTPNRASKQTTKLTTTASIPRSPRKAKQSALDKIAELSERDTLFWTQESVAEANDQKQAGSSMIEEARSVMKSMSISPAPSMAKDVREEGDMLANNSDDETPETSKRRTNARTTARSNTNKNEDWEPWTYSRSQGDRHLAKKPAVVSDEYEDSEPDISKYTVKNGVIVHQDDVKMLGLTEYQDKQRPMRSRRMGGGGHAAVAFEGLDNASRQGHAGLPKKKIHDKYGDEGLGCERSREEVKSHVRPFARSSRRLV